MPFSCVLVGRWLKSVQPYLASLVLHAAVLVVLSLILLPIGSEFKTNFLVSQLDPEELAELLETVPLDTSLSSSEQAPDFKRAWMESSSPAENLAVDVESVASLSAISLRRPDPTLTTRDRTEEASEAAASQIDTRWGTAPRKPSGTTEVREADSPGGALSTVTAAIRRELEQGDTLVVWLADASISLQNDRELMAQHMQSFYESLDAFDINDERQGTRLMNAVVAFASGTMEVLQPNRFGIKACAALADIPFDNTGIENVMSAVQRALVEYRRGRRRERMMIVVITDESGDDTVQLETTIELCREYHVPVHVIGPSAVLGAVRGSHAWVHPATGFKYLLPVRRGPDTAMPERMWLGYWHESGLPPWRTQGAQVAAGAKWYGGTYRERLISGFGPYALTRLSLQTGGSFTVLDRQADRSRFRLEDLRDYIPQYVSLREYEENLRDRPLRLAVSRVAASSMQPRIAVALSPPRTIFMGARSSVYPFPVYKVYVEPGAFPQRLLATLSSEDRAIAGTQKVLNRLLSAFNSKTVDWEREYSSEESPRWRAWYDLTKGRLLASMVRCMEYRYACRELPTRVPRGSNHIVLHNAPTLVVPQSEELAEEATRLLKRCADRNPNTPWAHLARWELDKGLGLRFTWSVFPRPRPSVTRPTRIPSFPRL